MKFSTNIALIVILLASTVITGAPGGLPTHGGTGDSTQTTQTEQKATTQQPATNQAKKNPAGKTTGNGAANGVTQATANKQEKGKGKGQGKGKEQGKGKGKDKGLIAKAVGAVENVAKDAARGVEIATKKAADTVKKVVGEKGKDKKNDAGTTTSTTTTNTPNSKTSKVTKKGPDGHSTTTNTETTKKGPNGKVTTTQTSKTHTHEKTPKKTKTITEAKITTQTTKPDSKSTEKKASKKTETKTANSKTTTAKKTASAKKTVDTQRFAECTNKCAICRGTKGGCLRCVGAWTVSNGALQPKKCGANFDEDDHCEFGNYDEKTNCKNCVKCKRGYRLKFCNKKKAEVCIKNNYEDDSFGITGCAKGRQYYLKKKGSMFKKFRCEECQHPYVKESCTSCVEHNDWNIKGLKNCQYGGVRKANFHFKKKYKTDQHHTKGTSNSKKNNQNKKHEEKGKDGKTSTSQSSSTTSSHTSSVTTTQSSSSSSSSTSQGGTEKIYYCRKCNKGYIWDETELECVKNPIAGCLEARKKEGKYVCRECDVSAGYYSNAPNQCKKLEKVAA